MTLDIVPHTWGHECSALDRGVSHYLGTFPTAAEAEAEQERTTDLLNRLAEEARLRERLDGRLDNLLRQRRGDVGAAPDGQQFP